MSLFEHLNKRAVVTVLALLIALGAFLVYFLSGDSEPPAVLTETEASPLEGTLGRELLVVLAKLKSTKLDTSLFTDPTFKSLRDFSVEIASQPVGRRNPFAVFEKAAKAGAKAPAKLPAGTGGKAKLPPPPPPEADLEEFSF